MNCETRVQHKGPPGPRWAIKETFEFFCPNILSRKIRCEMKPSRQSSRSLFLVCDISLFHGVCGCVCVCMCVCRHLQTESIDNFPDTSPTLCCKRLNRLRKSILKVHQRLLQQGRVHLDTASGPAEVCFFCVCVCVNMLQAHRLPPRPVSYLPQ